MDTTSPWTPCLGLEIEEQKVSGTGTKKTGASLLHVHVEPEGLVEDRGTKTLK